MPRFAALTIAENQQAANSVPQPTVRCRGQSGWLSRLPRIARWPISNSRPGEAGRRSHTATSVRPIASRIRSALRIFMAFYLAPTGRLGNTMEFDLESKLLKLTVSGSKLSMITGRVVSFCPFVFFA